MTEYNIKGIIAKIEKNVTKNGTEFKKLTLFNGCTTNTVKFNIFSNQANLDLIKEGNCFNFTLEDNGKYTNFISFDELSDSEKLELTPEQKDELMVIHYDEELPKTNTIYSKTKNESIEPEFIMLNGKKFITHKGLLNVAHSKGLAGIINELVSFINNTAIIKSTVNMKDKTSYTCYGDASPDNVNKNIVPHIIRMAETRAINRALRLATNIGECSIEELSENEDVIK